MSAEPLPPSRGMIDTNIVILRDWLEPEVLPDQFAICAVTLAELSVGHHAVRGNGYRAHVERARRTAILQRAEAEFDPLPFDATAARLYGELAAMWLAQGRTPRRRNTDLQIAATAVANHVPLYTAKPGDYAGLGDYLTVVPVPRPVAAP